MKPRTKQCSFSGFRWQKRMLGMGVGSPISLKTLCYLNRSMRIKGHVVPISYFGVCRFGIFSVQDKIFSAIAKYLHHVDSTI